METQTAIAMWTPDLVRRFLSRARASDAEWLLHALMLLYANPTTDWMFPSAVIRSQNVILRDGSRLFVGLHSPVTVNAGVWRLDFQFRAAWDKLMEEEEG